MKNKVFVASLLALTGLAVLFVFSPKVIINQRTDISEKTMESRLKNKSKTGLETLTSPLSSLVTETIETPLENSTREVKIGDLITVNYVGWLASTGVIFDQSFSRGDSGFQFTVGSGVITGWSEGVVGMKLGEIRRLKIPAQKAYADYSPSDAIPANSDLIFDVELTSIK